MKMKKGEKRKNEINKTRTQYYNFEPPPLSAVGYPGYQSHRVLTVGEGWHNLLATL